MERRTPHPEADKMRPTFERSLKRALKSLVDRGDVLIVAGEGGQRSPFTYTTVEALNQEPNTDDAKRNVFGEMAQYAITCSRVNGRRVIPANKESILGNDRTPQMARCQSFTQIDAMHQRFTVNRRADQALDRHLADRPEDLAASGSAACAMAHLQHSNARAPTAAEFVSGAGVMDSDDCRKEVG